MPDPQDRGLYGKYDVRRRDGKPVGQCFVLEVDDPFTHEALLVWADSVRKAGYSELAKDVELMVRAEQTWRSTTPGPNQGVPITEQGR